MSSDAKPEVLVLLSGGPDSAACLAFYAEMGRPMCALFVDYQQAAAEQEAAAARRLADHYDVVLARTTWIGNQDKPVGLIRGRNALLLTAALVEKPPTVGAVALGIHAGTSYADCSPEFVASMQAVYDTYDDRVEVLAPFMTWTKSDVWAFAGSSGVPLADTYSCEAGNDPGCGQCQSCRDIEQLRCYDAR